MTQRLPIADGQGYAMRAFALYGFLHTGQWVRFWELLTHPAQSVLAPHDVVFFLLPHFAAGAVSYVIVLYATTYGMLAAGVVMTSRELNRAEWAPVILLFCGINNVALIDFYSFYIDMQFLAAALLGLAWQIKAWNERQAWASLLAGAMVGALFFFKPANALIYAFIYLLTEMIYMGFTLKSGTAFQVLRHDIFYKFCGFIPFTALAFLCEAGQSILLLIDQNEVSRIPADLQSGGLLRLLYFPLCLSVFYHVVLLGGLLRRDVSRDTKTGRCIRSFSLAAFSPERHRVYSVRRIFLVLDAGQADARSACCAAFAMDRRLLVLGKAPLGASSPFSSSQLFIQSPLSRKRNSICWVRMTSWSRMIISLIGNRGSRCRRRGGTAAA